MTKDPKKILDFLNMERDTLELEFSPRSMQRAYDLCAMAKLDPNETMEVVLAFTSDSFKLEERSTLDLMQLYCDVANTIRITRDEKIMEYYNTLVTAIENEAKGR